MNDPLVSIGVPVYNGEKYVGEAIDSVLAQTYGNFELIVRDNASTDGTEAVCRTFARRDGRIRYTRNHRNVGAGPNFNGIVPLARGEYFKWLAHDDLMEPSFLARCVEALTADSTAVLACPRVRYIDANGITLGDYASPFRTDSPDRIVRFRELLQAHRCFEVFGLIRLADLRRTRLMGCYGGGDGVLLAHLALRGRFAEIPEPLYLLRRHEKQSMHLFDVTNARGALDFEAYACWFDPNNRTRVPRSFNRMLAEYLRMIRVTPMSSAERRACYGVVFRWLCRRWRIIAGEWKRTIYHACGLPSLPRQPKKRFR